MTKNKTMKVSLHQEHIAVLYVYAINKRASEHMKQTNRTKRKKTDQFTMTVEDFSTPLTTIELLDKNITKDTELHTINQ